MNKPFSFMILSEAEQPGKLALCLIRDCALEAANIQEMA
jgi:hypothetical protein